MKTVATIEALRALRQGTIGFVPTMGALHEGHLALMRLAATECDLVVASIFVNPLQFGPHEDFEAYPRHPERDAELARSAGVDVLFLPDSSEILGMGTTRLIAGAPSEGFEGEARPGHFDGVATIVAKLFLAVGPDVAYFGLKDLQQCAVIRAMVDDLHFPVQLTFMETVREPDGLAMSSRNAYLSPDSRATAPQLFAVLSAAGQRIRAGMSRADFEPMLREAITCLQQRGFGVEYLELVDPKTLKHCIVASVDSRIIVAARLGPVRLIDNVQIGQSA